MGWETSEKGWVLMMSGVVGVVISVCLLYKLVIGRSDERSVKEKDEFVIPRGRWGWPLMGETLEFIASAYTSKPVTFMDTRKSLLRPESPKILNLRVLLSIGPGEEMNLLKTEFEEFIKGLVCLPIKLPGTRLYKSLKAMERLLKMVKTVIEERQIALEKIQEKGFPDDVVDVLLRDIGGSDEMQPLDFISGNIVEMMIPGEEIVPTAMTLAVKFLTNNPVALAHLVEENMELKKRKDHSNEEYSWTDYMSLSFTQNTSKYHQCSVEKTLKDVKIKGYLIPKGWCVLASLSLVHMDETNYENPYELDPWRWKQTGAGVSSNIFIPFGGGQRLCPGLELSKLEISIFLHHLVTTYRWGAEKDDIIYFPTVRMKGKLPIIIMPL
ncbi:hypothetical protein BUALT_Bualt11G0004700 [Buddleja alternifolia]|uniref:Cytochrome P450 n=1 Tax=Buddleja alternifolia TaxID=168488 RepID=A0AAV6X2A9_9LAMI|nr:hypothetical protein BUALT_Bualt11G0004700 [Buddleja alternifolia]